MARYKLELKRLDWISPVDVPAQETARVVLIKRRELSGFAQAVKVDEGLGLVFCWAFTSKVNDEDYYDLQQDKVDENFVRAAADFMSKGGPTDEMHDERSDGRVVFCMPMTPEIASAFGVTTKTTGLMVALKPSAEVLAKFKSGEYTGVSIQGIGERTKVASAGHNAFRETTLDQPIVCLAVGKRAPSRYDADDRSDVLKATWTVATIDDLPDSSFLYIEGGGSKDDTGKTSPRSLRHFPYKDENGKVDLPHLRDAISRIPQSSLPATLRNKLQAKAERILGQQHDDASKRLAKRSLLTTAVAGHVHLLDDGGDAPSGETDYRPMEGADDGGYHSHPWARSDNGTIVIGESLGHTHEVADIEAIVAAGEADDVEDDTSAGKRAGNSPRTDPVRNPGLVTKEQTQMPDAKDTQIADLTKRAERAERIAKMSGPHKSHFDSLTGEDAEVFLAKSAADREVVVQKALEDDKPIWTGDVTKVAVRKRDGELALQLAKQNEANAVALAKREAEIEKAEIATIAKSHLGSLAGEDDVHAYVVASCRKGGGDAAMLEKVFTAMKGWNALGVTAAKAKGINPGSDGNATDPASTYDAFEKGLTAFAKANSVPAPKLWTEGLDAYIQTPEGAALKSAYDTARAAAM